MLPRHAASRYVQPLREGGSLPAVVEVEGGDLFVVKFRGAGQGARVLVAELIVGALAQRLGLRTPELAVIDISERFGRSEPDPEIQDLLRRSHGANVGMRFLEGAFNFEASAAGSLVSPELAAQVVWLDAFTTNPDRTHRNPNMMVWQQEAWLIDHGAALYAHHDWASVDEARTRTPFPLIRSHVLMPVAGDLAAADAASSARLSADAIGEIVDTVPDALLMDVVAGTGDFPSADAARARYARYLGERLAARESWLGEAIRAQEQVRLEPPIAMKSRR